MRQPELESREAVGDKVLHQACVLEKGLMTHGTAPRDPSVEMLAVRRMESLLPSLFSSLIALLADTANSQANFLSYLVTQMKVLSYCD